MPNYITRKVGALARKQAGRPSACVRPGCTGTGKPHYCSRRCAGVDLLRRVGRDRFVAAGLKSGRVRRAMFVAKSHDYKLGYRAGWLASQRWFEHRGAEIRRGRHGQKLRQIAATERGAA